MTVDSIFTSILLLLPYYTLTLTVVLALLLDKILGEAKRYHYLVGFGWLTLQLEKQLNPNTININKNNKKTNNSNTEPLTFEYTNALLGGFSWLLLVLPLPLFYFLYLNNLPWYWQTVLDATMLYLALGLNSLYHHAMQVYEPLKASDLTKARYFTGYLVSRNTEELTPTEISRATVESMLENGHDSVIASMVYYLIGGAPLVILHRFANTLDAMWGYKTAQFNAFGYTSARLDDVLGFITGKICTLLYAMQGKFIQASVNAYQQGNLYKSHNGGWVMAAGATVLKIKLGGTAQYNGKATTSVILGCGQTVEVEDIQSSVNIVQRAAILLTLLLFLGQSIFIVITTY